MTPLESWGKYPATTHELSELWWRDEVQISETTSSVLAYGKGRSYGDVCLNDGGLLLYTKGLSRFISFNEKEGLLCVEAGVTLDQILKLTVPKGWFLPVTPGTKYVTVGGAVANDVHGKNHHRAGTFGMHVEEIELLRSTGERLLCSLKKNTELYRATIGGLGLTGLILSVQFKLKKIQSSLMSTESIKFSSLDEFAEISSGSDKNFEYTVAWLDCVTAKNSLGRGIFMRGNHSEKTTDRSVHKEARLCMPIHAPGFALNRFSMGLFNSLYYGKQREKIQEKEQHYDPFFYPLDAVLGWNKIYGKRGFLQFQCVLPKDQKLSGIKKILTLAVDSGRASFLSVIKEFGDPKSPGLLSFPRPGTTLCMDFPFEGENTLSLFQDFDAIVRDFGGRMYPGKDACMSPESFQQYFPEYRKFSEYIDPKFSSSFWRRVLTEEKK